MIAVWLAAGLLARQPAAPPVIPPIVAPSGGFAWWPSDEEADLPQNDDDEVMLAVINQFVRILSSG